MRNLKTLFAATLAAVCVLAAPLPALTQTYKAGDIEIAQPWSRATPQGAKIAAGYLALTNKGSSSDRLVSATATIGNRVELHEMATRDGVMTMRPVTGGITVEPGKTITLAPGGLHMMFMNIATPLKRGDTFTATLAFEKAGQVQVTFTVEAIGARQPASGPHQGH